MTRLLSLIVAILVTAQLAAAPRASADGYENFPTTLTTGQSMYPVSVLAAGNYQLVMQTDGNLVEYQGGVALWSTGTAGHPGAVFRLQADGNAVIYGSSGAALWWTGTNGVGSAATFVLQSDGNVVLYGPSGPRWFTGLPLFNRLGPGDTLSGQATRRFTSASGEIQASEFAGQLTFIDFLGSNPNGGPTAYGNASVDTLVLGTAQPLMASAPYPFGRAVMQTDGNLVVYGPSGAPTWSSGTAGSGNANYAVLQDDGSLVMYTASGARVWSSNSRPAFLSPGSSLRPGEAIQSGVEPFGATVGSMQLVMQTDGNLVAYANGRAVWSSGTFVAGSTAIMQTDGNFVMYSPQGSALWQSATVGAGPAILAAMNHCAPNLTTPYCLSISLIDSRGIARRSVYAEGGSGL